MESGVAWIAAISEKFLKSLSFFLGIVGNHTFYYFFLIYFCKYFQNFVFNHTVLIGLTKYILSCFKDEISICGIQKPLLEFMVVLPLLSGQIYAIEHTRNLPIILAAILILRSRSLGINVLVWCQTPDFRWFMKESQPSTFSCLLQILNSNCKGMQLSFLFVQRIFFASDRWNLLKIKWYMPIDSKGV